MFFWWSCLSHLDLPRVLRVIIYGWWGGLKAFAFGNGCMQLIQQQHNNKASNQNSSEQAVWKALFTVCTTRTNAGYVEIHACDGAVWQSNTQHALSQSAKRSANQLDLLLASSCAVLNASEPSGNMTPSAVPISSPAPTADMVCSWVSETVRIKGAYPEVTEHFCLWFSAGHGGADRRTRAHELSGKLLCPTYPPTQTQRT